MTHFKFLHTSDLQLGMQRWFLEGEAQARYDSARKDVIATLGQAAVEHKCSCILVAGDVFEHNAIDPKIRERAIAEFSKLPVPVYLLPGNHDPLTADSIFRSVEKYDNIHVIGDNALIQLAHDVELVGAPLVSKRSARDLVAEALRPLAPTQKIRIAIGHGQVLARGNDSSFDVIDLGFVEQKLADATIDYLALGDTHSAMSLSETGKVWYSGAPEVTDFLEYPAGNGENNSGKALVVEIEKAGTAASVNVTEIEVGKWRFVAPTWQVNSAADVEEFCQWLDSFEHKDTTVIKYALIGSVDATTMQWLEEQLTKQKVLFAALYHRERTHNLVLEPTDEDLAAMNVSGFVKQACESLLDDPTPQAKDALSLLFKLNREVEGR
ncbi:exonuclease SbcCD subunit D [Corynebacterium sp. HS2168-gen11]|uniref:metallophosphoesterase family protein n=1 Tax=Corynebacterium sp. HS2168-gen11 TaxID=2974027 RepID=UPI00216B2337|nr:exonuclease SbcCD subunit D [Corynebacterium sp. HS2168-gen11]MCS4534889.1 exonuclease SbcCD subunit D [Corynebacterium sp. HS2168-gen11]